MAAQDPLADRVTSPGHLPVSQSLTKIISKLRNNFLVLCIRGDTLKELLIFSFALRLRDPKKDLEMLRKTVSICILIAIVALVFRTGDLSIDARDFIQDRLSELRIMLQQD